MEQLAIESQDLWFYYHDHLILREVDLQIEQRDFLCILGPNGGGKTTLVKLMLGLLRPYQGKVRLLGEKPWRVSHRAGYVPQDTNTNRTFPVTVMDVALMGQLGSSGRGWGYSARERAAAQEALEQMGMWEQRGERIGSLSGGQRQRVFIARALVAQPEVLFLDEPTSSVDTEGQSELYEFLKELNETVTVVVISHDLSALSRYVKSVACVNQRVYYHDAAELTRDMLDQVYHCPIDLIAHGVPHRVLCAHRDD